MVKPAGTKPARAKAAPKRDLIEETRDRSIAKRKSRLDALTELVTQRMADVVADFWDIGQALAEILDDKLYLADGHKTFEAFLKARKLPSRAQAAKLIAVSRSMPRARALALGPEKTHALLAFTRATAEDDTPEGLLDEGRRFAGKSIEEASVRDIKASTSAERAKSTSARPKTAAQAERDRADEALRRAINRALKAAGLTGATVTVTNKVVRAEWPRDLAERRVEK